MGQLNVNGTIDITGNVLTPNRPAFRIKLSNCNGETFGSDSGQTYTVAYDDIFPLFKSNHRTVDKILVVVLRFMTVLHLQAQEHIGNLLHQ